MARREVSGVRGVLSELISAVPSEQNGPSNSLDSPPKSGTIAHPPPKRTEPTKPRARLGRPPGCLSGKTPPKEKVTVRIDARLVALYRDWSWDERCQLGELFERALREYRNNKA